MYLALFQKNKLAAVFITVLISWSSDSSAQEPCDMVWVNKFYLLAKEEFWASVDAANRRLPQFGIGGQCAHAESARTYMEEMARYMKYCGPDDGMDSKLRNKLIDELVAMMEYQYLVCECRPFC